MRRITGYLRRWLPSGLKRQWHWHHRMENLEARNCFAGDFALAGDFVDIPWSDQLADVNETVEHPTTQESPSSPRFFALEEAHSEEVLSEEVFSEEVFSEEVFSEEVFSEEVFSEEVDRKEETSEPHSDASFDEEAVNQEKLLPNDDEQSISGDLKGGWTEFDNYLPNEEIGDKPAYDPDEFWQADWDDESADAFAPDDVKEPDSDADFTSEDSAFEGHIPGDKPTNEELFQPQSSDGGDAPPLDEPEVDTSLLEVPMLNDNDSCDPFYGEDGAVYYPLCYEPERPSKFHPHPNDGDAANSGQPQTEMPAPRSASEVSARLASSGVAFPDLGRPQLLGLPQLRVMPRELTLRERMDGLGVGYPVAAAYQPPMVPGQAIQAWSPQPVKVEAPTHRSTTTSGMSWDTWLELAKLAIQNKVSSESKARPQVVNVPWLMPDPSRRPVKSDEPDQEAATTRPDRPTAEPNWPLTTTDASDLPLRDPQARQIDAAPRTPVPEEPVSDQSEKEQPAKFGQVLGPTPVLAGSGGLLLALWPAAWSRARRLKFWIRRLGTDKKNTRR